MQIWEASLAISPLVSILQHLEKALTQFSSIALVWKLSKKQKFYFLRNS
jgi:hypothetical protein